jgi:hypothetical protein
MQKSTQVLITFMFVIVLVAGLYIFTDWFSQVTGYFTGESEKEELVLCLNSLGVEFYGTTQCADCEKQEKLLGGAFSKIKKIDCGTNKEFCQNFREIPAWYINKEIHYGFKSLNELKEISGCAN